ncbi:helix-turn-helix transcriptional regulator [Rufibacter roseus]|uniref:Helix-turn-helix transcriptional regulator n=1 Tax=Rufibacter roseus TaxID=1567108 RepID=A0ABW2DP20_9BACT|nr:WYL domain-containing protein [Rufibacter roseus]
MATNKNAMLRYMVLDNCFRNTGRRYFIQDLIEACNRQLLEIDPNSKGISRRQILDDIAFMESGEGWSIELARFRDGKKVYYRYEDPSFSINNMPLNEVEVNQLKTAVEILSQFKGMPQFEWVHELLPKLNQGLSTTKTESTIIDFDSNQYLKGIEHLGTLHSAIYHKRVLSIKYHPFEVDRPYDIEIHPYYLKQYNNRWFLFGYNPYSDRSDWNLALDRILDINEINDKYKPNKTIDWVEYFDDIIGVTRPVDGALETVLLHFAGRTGKYIESKPIHSSQRTKWINPELLEVKIEVMINYELERLILSYGSSVKVISPESLKNKITDSLQKAHSQYLLSGD